LKSFGYALSGLGFMLRTQHNAWLHLAATGLVLILGLLFKVGLGDWRWLIAAILMVWSAEAFNTAVEYVCDVVSPGYSLVVKNAKDIAAGQRFSMRLSRIFGIGAGDVSPQGHS
jgi:diacylglycerol kinase